MVGGNLKIARLNATFMKDRHHDLRKNKILLVWKLKFCFLIWINFRVKKFVKFSTNLRKLFLKHPCLSAPGWEYFEKKRPGQMLGPNNFRIVALESYPWAYVTKIYCTSQTPRTSRNSSAVNSRTARRKQFERTTRRRRNASCPTITDDENRASISRYWHQRSRRGGCRGGPPSARRDAGGGLKYIHKLLTYISVFPITFTW